MNKDQLLIEASIKQISLMQKSAWNNELLDKAPPVLWFGNSKSEKPKVLTCGANPSRWEFLSQPDCKGYPMVKKNYETKYLLNNKKRFYNINGNQRIVDILSKGNLRSNIIDSYDNYFKSGNSYRWFGTNKQLSYNAEGLLRGLCSSYFEINSIYRACHIDLFPLATISDFNKIKNLVEKDILANNWAKTIIDDLISIFYPEVMIIFGKSNFDYFCNYLSVSKGKQIKWKSTINKGKCNYYLTKYGSIKIIGLSVNLGNPKFFDAKGLHELGKELSLKLNLCP